MPINRNFWHNRRVLVTGVTGFKGAWLSLLLQTLGAKVTGIADRVPTEPSLFELASIKDLIEFHQADVRDLAAMRKIVADFRPEIVLHLAAQALVRPSYTDPVTTFSTNIMGTVNLLEAVRLDGQVKAVVNVTTDKCYENHEWAWGYREIDRLGGHDPYSNSKACSELVTASYRQSFFSEPTKTAIATARAGNVIGGGDWAAERLIPDIFRAWLANEPAIIRNPASIRPWQHVLEALHGYLLLAEKLLESPSEFAQAWNFGPGESDARNVGWIAQHLQQRLPDLKLQIGSVAGPHEAAYLRLDCAKARNLLNWHPTLSLEQALDLIIEWYQACRQKHNLRLATQKQINDFLDAINQ
ncbi:MAG: CDP-glucose 4,6-dehydratase [Candidatus Rifleibacteriota bacterium]